MVSFTDDCLSLCLHEQKAPSEHAETLREAFGAATPLKGSLCTCTIFAPLRDNHTAETGRQHQEEHTMQKPRKAPEGLRCAIFDIDGTLSGEQLLQGNGSISRKQAIRNKGNSIGGNAL